MKKFLYRLASIAAWLSVLIAAAITLATIARTYQIWRLERFKEEAQIIVPANMAPVQESDPCEVVYLSCEVTYEEPAPVAVYPAPLSAELQDYIIHLCEQYQIPPELVLAVIEKESGYDVAATGDSGKSQGLMQIQLRWHKERMIRLACTDLYDPRQNVTVGVDFLAELLGQYQTVEMALMVYNAGAGGAQNLWFSQGIYSNDYSRSVVARAAELEAEA